LKVIGGFFQLEKTEPTGMDMHPKAAALHTGRACLMVMLSYLSPLRVFVPYYTCDAILEPFYKLKIEIIFYAIDEDFLPKNI
jgi:hypothetical protein